MKKKLKVKKAFSGSMMNAARRMVRPGTPIRQSIQDLDLKEATPPSRTNILPRFPRGPRSSAIINPVRPGHIIPTSTPIAGLQNIYNKFGGMGPQQVQQPQPGVQPIIPRDYGFGSGPMQQPQQPVGDPRLGAATIPENVLQMQMRAPTQAAPVQPVPAMKKGGSVIARGNKLARSKPTKMF